MTISAFHIHDVTAVELASTYLANRNSRTIRISTRDYLGHESTLEIALFGDSEAAEALPRASDFHAHTGKPAADIAA